MMLLDKGYFDYDFVKTEAPVIWEDTIKTDEEVNDILSMFGLGNKNKITEQEDIQKHIIKQLEEQ